jgi:RimJ/RimL family protein N-acetyltransferase
MPGPVFIPGDSVDLHTIEEEDLEFLQESVNDPQVWRRIGRNHPVNAQQEREFFEEIVGGDDGVHLLVCADGEPVGTVGVNGLDGPETPELGYWIAPDHHRQGYATAAAKLLTGYAFDQLGLHRVEARVFEFNDASQTVLERVGFTHEGTSREAAFVDGEYRDALWYGMLEEEWREGA